MRERIPEDEIEAKQADTLKAFSGDSSPEEPEFGLYLTSAISMTQCSA